MMTNKPDKLGLGDRTTKLCDGDCGRVYYVTDLNLNSHGDYMCNNCIFDFVATDITHNYTPEQLIILEQDYSKLDNEEDLL